MTDWLAWVFDFSNAGFVAMWSTFVLSVAFALFLVLQFLDVIGWVCRYNVERGPARMEGYGFNVAYQLTLGPNAWPVLLQAANHLPPGEIRDDLRLGLREIASRAKGLAEINWRERQIRRDRNAAALFAWAQPLGPLTPITVE